MQYTPEIAFIPFFMRHFAPFFMKREQNMTKIEKLLCCLITACVSSGIITAQTAMKTITGSVTDSAVNPSM